MARPSRNASRPNPPSGPNWPLTWGRHRFSPCFRHVTGSHRVATPPSSRPFPRQHDQRSVSTSGWVVAWGLKTRLRHCAHPSPASASSARATGVPTSSATSPNCPGHPSQPSPTPTPATLFNAPGIDAVVIATPAETHYALAREALLAGKHVFVEKPLATSGAQCLELARIAHDRGLTLMAGHTFVHNDALRWTKQQLDAGTLGDVHYLYSRRLNLGQIRQDINVVWNLAPHDISIMGFLLDARPNRVSCAGYAYIQNGVEDVAFITLEYPPATPTGTPRSAHIHVSWLDPHKVREVVVVGTRQMIVYDDVDARARPAATPRRTRANAPRPMASSSCSSAGETCTSRACASANPCATRWPTTCTASQRAHARSPMP
ncbi:MAG: gfo/Idh/MocA family oxidoreductase [Chloroflexi bacterium]|nr:gfo/Idh/MocA family oxidoreductase [Chloroflexota bacterium]